MYGRFLEKSRSSPDIIQNQPELDRFSDFQIIHYSFFSPQDLSISPLF